MLCGKWKFVISASTALILTPGVMKICVKPLPGWTTPSSVATVYSVRTLVVPTQTIRPPRARAALIFSACSGVTS